MNLHGKRVLLTGAGSGIGLATARLLGSRGARLVVFGRRAAPLEALRAELPGAVVVAGDVADAAARTRAITTAVEAFGGLDILINNAGIVRAGRLEGTEEAEIRAMIDVDLLAPILLTREALPQLRQSGDAAVVNVTSVAALVGMPFYATYAAAKGGLYRFGEALRRELLGEGVHVMTVHPSATDTPMMATNTAGGGLGFPQGAAGGRCRGAGRRAGGGRPGGDPWRRDALGDDCRQPRASRTGGRAVPWAESTAGGGRRRPPGAVATMGGESQNPEGWCTPSRPAVLPTPTRPPVRQGPCARERSGDPRHIAVPGEDAGGSRAPYDHHKLVSTIPGEQAFRSMTQGGCNLVAQ